MSALAFAPRGLTWAFVRLHRIGLLAWIVYLSVLTGYLVRDYFWVRSPVSTADCVAGGGRLGADGVCTGGPFHGSLYLDVITWQIAWLPFAFGVYAAGALIARELETGTAALAWTQSASPARWLAAKLALPAALLTAGMTLLVLLVRWVDTAGTEPGHTELDWTYPDHYLSLGPTGVAYALCALAVGALAGLVVRRSLGAMAVALAATLVVNDLGNRVRGQLWTDEAWGLKLLWSEDGIGDRPAADFWPMQLIETGLVLTLTAALTATAFWLLRRRTP
ncbi:hypothetical protein ACIBI4_33670 [Streptomyces sp. NPDC050418]|uniref:hypothetical protein n=1 Tax=Streptomyces sp. NPDC050418 TaxID=3365612 RepID=UPI003787CBB6